MNTVNRSKCRVPTSTNCSGSTTKKASTRAAVVAAPRGRERDELAQRKNATSANNTVAAVSPSTQPTQNTVAMAQEVRKARAGAVPLALQGGGGVGIPQAFCAAGRAQMVTGEHTKDPRETAHRSVAWWRLQPAKIHRGHTSLKAMTARRAVEERAAFLAGLRDGWCTKGHRTQDGHGTTSPFGMTRCTLLIHAGTSTTWGNICASRNRPTEGLRVVAMAARALGEDDDRVAAFQRAHQRGQRVALGQGGAQPPGLGGGGASPGRVWPAGLGAVGNDQAGAARGRGRRGRLALHVNGVEHAAVVIHCRTAVWSSSRARGDRARMLRSSGSAAQIITSRHGSGGWRNRCAAPALGGQYTSGPGSR